MVLVMANSAFSLEIQKGWCACSILMILMKAYRGGGSLSSWCIHFLSQVSQVLLDMCDDFYVLSALRFINMSL